MHIDDSSVKCVPSKYIDDTYVKVCVLTNNSVSVYISVACNIMQKNVVVLLFCTSEVKIDKHLSESELISVKCKWCKEVYPLGEVNQHELNCNTLIAYYIDKTLIV